MASKTYTLNHITYATEWDHVNAAYIAATEVDGELFERPSEKACVSKPVMDAMALLQKAVLKELAADSKNAEIRTMRDVRAERQALAEAEGPPAATGEAPAPKKTSPKRASK